MRITKWLATAGVTGVIAAGLVVSPVFAWHPVGVINKSVQDTTTSSALEDANDASSALTVNSGDTLQYVIKVSNDGAPASNGDNDMAKTVLTDTLPSGVELVSDPTQTQISANLGTIKAGASVTETYEVKVTSTTDGEVITNKACFTGNSLANDNAQSGCDTAVVKVHVTPPAPTPTPTPKPTPTPTPAQPTVLPNTGAGNLIAPAAVVLSVLGYAGYLLRLKRHTT